MPDGSRLDWRTQFQAISSAVKKREPTIMAAPGSRVRVVNENITRTGTLLGGVVLPVTTKEGHVLGSDMFGVVELDNGFWSEDRLEFVSVIVAHADCIEELSA
jgi:hypothetical protein